MTFDNLVPRERIIIGMSRRSPKKSQLLIIVIFFIDFLVGK